MLNLLSYYTSGRILYQHGQTNISPLSTPIIKATRRRHLYHLFYLVSALISLQQITYGAALITGAEWYLTWDLYYRYTTPELSAFDGHFFLYICPLQLYGLYAHFSLLYRPDEEVWRHFSFLAVTSRDYFEGQISAAVSVAQANNEGGRQPLITSKTTKLFTVLLQKCEFNLFQTWFKKRNKNLSTCRVFSHHQKLPFYCLLEERHQCRLLLVVYLFEMATGACSLTTS